MGEPEPERCCFDDWVDHWTAEATKKPTAAKVTGSLLDAITEAGVAERTVLDVGCGIGDLAIEVVARGAASGTGYDLSPKAIDEARRLAASRGVGDRMRFEVGDGAKLDLPAADIVVINRVVCCYPDTEKLLDHTLGAARSVFAITAPVSKGPTGWWNRLWSTLENVGYRLRPSKYGGFRTFIHDLDRIDERIRAAGFRRVRHERRRVVWDLAVYTR
ncbi:MAG TPA: methyltransferase domain-containing protein [Actinomycetota bacterium]|nr:methyltransferase domain-containing protein [Actinomycetota bacterium]